MEEVQQRGGRKRHHELRRSAPHGRTHGHEVKIEEVVAVAARTHVVAQRQRSGFRLTQRGHRLLVEAVNLQEHPDEPGAKQVAALGEEMVQR